MKALILLASMALLIACKPPEYTEYERAALDGRARTTCLGGYLHIETGFVGFRSYRVTQIVSETGKGIPCNNKPER